MASATRRGARVRCRTGADLYLLENLKLDELVAKRVNEFAFVMRPMKAAGFTGSTVAPVAIRELCSEPVLRQQLAEKPGLEQAPGVGLGFAVVHLFLFTAAGDPLDALAIGGQAQPV